MLVVLGVVLQIIAFGLLGFALSRLRTLQRRNERNDAVHEYRLTLLNRISLLAKEDTNAGKQWLWRYQDFESVSHRAMVDNEDRPLEDFYKDS